MCIICRTHGDPHEFLNNWHAALFHMKKAEKAMYEYAKNDKNYDVFHKKLVKARKSFAKLEMQREITTPN